jgi:(p)ppGpp synthase/HD superfamily hydrolase
VTNNSRNLTQRFKDALIYTANLHSGQFRKGTKIPYIAHLLGVTALVLEAGGDEDVAIAALLHDAVEDQGGLQTLAEIKNRFGDRVATIVAGCSDSHTHPKPPWKIRKESYLAHLRDASPEVQLVSLADKLHNARSIYRDLKENGPQIFNKFKGEKSGTLWYYDRLVEIFTELGTNTMTQELSRVVNQIKSFAENNPTNYE